MAIQEFIDNLRLQLDMFYRDERETDASRFWSNAIEKSIMFELIKDAYDSCEPTTSLRNHRGSDDDNLRMRDSRAMAYAQHYRSIQYEELKDKFDYIESRLLPDKMDSINDKLSGHRLNDMQYFELQELADVRLFKAITKKRIGDVKKFSNSDFIDAMAEYDRLVQSLADKLSGSDDDVLFGTLQLYTLEWKYNVDLFYRAAVEAEKRHVTDVPFDDIGMMCAAMTIRHPIDPNCEAHTESRMIPYRNEVVGLAFEENEKSNLKERLNQYLQFKIYAFAIPVEGETLKDEFRAMTTRQEWAEYIRNNFDIASMLSVKKWTRDRIRYVRKLYRRMYRTLPTPKSN